MNLDKMSDLLCKVLTNSYDNLGTTTALAELRLQVDEAARKVSGVRTEELADENMEDSAIVRLYWTTNSEIMAKVLIMAAQKQSYYQEIQG